MGFDILGTSSIAGITEAEAEVQIDKLGEGIPLTQSVKNLFQ